MTSRLQSLHFLRIILWVVGAFVLVNIVALVSPWKILIKSVDRKFILDYNIIRDVPMNAGDIWSGRKVRREKVCVYWEGAIATSPVFITANEHCPLIF